MHPFYKGCIRGIPGVKCVAVADDLNLIGNPEGVFKAFKRFETSLHGSGLVLRREKCGVLWPKSGPVPDSVRLPAEQMNITLHYGVMHTFGVLVGSGDDHFHRWLADQIDSYVPYLKLLEHPELPAQVAMLLFRLSVIPSVGYLTRVIRPSILAPHAKNFDQLVLDSVQRKFALPTPLPNAAKLTLSLPIKAGGFGLTSAAAVSIPAYFCALSEASEAILDLLPPTRATQLLFGDEKQRAPFAQEASFCLDALITADVVHGLDGPIPSTIEDFWKPGVFIAALPRRQHGISSQIVLHKFRDWFGTANLKDKQRIVSSSASKAGLWLTTYPSLPELSLVDDYFLLAVKHRLGVQPMNDLPDTCTCTANLAGDSQHFFSCKKLKRKAMTVRHDAIVRLLRDAFHHVGAVVHVEPRLYDTERVRPDLDILLPDQNVMIDVAVTHPGAPCRKTEYALAAANDLQSIKNKKYGDWATQRGGRFLPFVLETHGALGKQADAVLKLLAKVASHSSAVLSVTDFLKEFKQKLSVTLQRGNALVAKLGAVNSRAAAAAAQRASRLR
jgi:hypothetical protein